MNRLRFKLEIKQKLYNAIEKCCVKKDLQLVISKWKAYVSRIIKVHFGLDNLMTLLEKYS